MVSLRACSSSAMRRAMSSSGLSVKPLAPSTRRGSGACPGHYSAFGIPTSRPFLVCFPLSVKVCVLLHWRVAAGVEFRRQAGTRLPYRQSSRALVLGLGVYLPYPLTEGVGPPYDGLAIGDLNGANEGVKGPVSAIGNGAV